MGIYFSIPIMDDSFDKKIYNRTRKIRDRLGSSSYSRKRYSSNINSNKNNNGWPGGSWKKTAKMYYIYNKTLYAYLKDKKGRYVKDSIKFEEGDEFENDDGHFVIVEKDSYYRKTAFDVYYKNKKIDISPVGFKVLGDGYAKNNFDVVYRGKKVDISSIGFTVLKDGYAKNNFDVIYRGKKVDISPIGFTVLNDGYAKNNFDMVYKGEKISS
jgi:hypothetical protein